MSKDLNKLEVFHRLKKQRYASVEDVRKVIEPKIKSGKITTAEIFSAIDTAGGLSEDWLKDVGRSYSLHTYGTVKDDIVEKFRQYTPEEKEAMKSDAETFSKAENFAIDTTNLIDTTAFPVMEGLLRESPLISRVNVQRETEYKPLLDMDEEKDAETLPKTGNGAEADDVIRKALTLDNTDKKIQASTTIHERDLMNMEPTEIGMFMSRLQRRIDYEFGRNIAYADGTDNQFARGIINSVGGTVNNNHIGSIAFDLAGSGAADHVEALEIVDGDLPTFLSQADENLYTLLANRKTISKIRRTRNGVSGDRYFSATDNVSIAGKPVINVPAMADDQVAFAVLPYYQVIMAGNGNLLSDEGIVNLKAGTITYTIRIYADGSPRMAFKYKSGTTVSTGSEPHDNQDRNYFRHASLLASYA